MGSTKKQQDRPLWLGLHDLLVCRFSSCFEILERICGSLALQRIWNCGRVRLLGDVSKRPINSSIGCVKLCSFRCWVNEIALDASSPLLLSPPLLQLTTAFQVCWARWVERSKSEVENSPATDVPRYSQPEMRGSSSVTRSLALVVKLLDRLEALLFTMPTAPRFIVTKRPQNQSINATGPAPLPVSQGGFGLPADGTLTVRTGLIA